MNRLLLISLVFAATHVNAAEVLGDFWDKCPGPACPGNRPDNPSIIYGEKIRKEEVLRRERELLDRERLLLEREIRLRDKML
jgi:hypothetical protein